VEDQRELRMRECRDPTHCAIVDGRKKSTNGGFSSGMNPNPRDTDETVPVEREGMLI
jgi:hypothetical protein